MDAVERTDFINYIEEKFPVDKWEVYGVKVWPLLRIKIGFCLEEGYLVKTSSKDATYNIITQTLSRAYHFIYGIIIDMLIYILDYKNNDTLHKRAEAVFLFNAPNEMLSGKWFHKYKPYVDALEEQNKKVLILQNNTLNYLHIPRKSKDVLFKPYLLFIRLKCYAKFFLNQQGLLNKRHYQLERYDEFISFCQNHGISFKGLTKKKLIEIIYVINETRKFLRNILDCVGANICFVVCYYDQMGMALCLACRDLAIASVDIQHGVQGEYHYAYGRWSKLPSDGFAMLPDYFWCWSEDDVQAINKWAHNNNKHHKAFLGGDLWVNQFLGRDLAELDAEIIAENMVVYEKIKTKDKSLVILYTLHTYFPVEDWVYETINDSPNDWLWLIRLHPSELDKIKMRKESFHNNCSGSVLIDDIISTKPLPLLLKYTDIHLTAFSSVVIEANSFGIPSIVTNEIGIQYYRDLIKEGSVISASNYEELYCAIRKLQNRKGSESAFDHKNMDKKRMKTLINMVKSV